MIDVGRTRAWLLILGILLGVGVVVGWSAEAPTLETCAAAVERASRLPEGERVVLGHISRRLDLPATTLRAQRARTGLGWGDLFIANYLAAAARVPFEQVVAEFGAEHGWTEVVQRHGVDADKLLGDLRRSQEVIEKRAEDRPPPRIETGGGFGAPAPGGGGTRGRRY